MSDLVFSKIRRSNDGSQTDAISIHCQFTSVRCVQWRNSGTLLSDLIPSIIRRSTYCWQTDAISPTFNFHRLDVCIWAIFECYCPIFFLPKYGGSVVVWRPMQCVSLSISVGQMFAMEQFWNVIVRSYSFQITTVQWWFEGRCILSHCQFTSVRCLQRSHSGMILSDVISSKIRPSSDSSQTSAISPTVKFRRSDV